MVPGQNVVASSAEGRRNYTDAQETAQWLGGDHIPEQILSDLLNSHLLLLKYFGVQDVIAQRPVLCSGFPLTLDLPWASHHGEALAMRSSQ